MYAAGNESTGSAHECAPAPAGPSSSAAGPRVAIASRPDLFMVPRRGYRSLRRHSDFSRAYRSGRRQRCGAVTVVSLPGPSGPPTIGFVAGKRVGAAVLRNRAKRRMREATARCRPKSDTVYVLIADRGVLTADFDSLVRWIGRCTEEQSMALERV